MDRLRGWLKQLRAALLPGRVEREMHDELAFHVDQETKRNQALGMTPAAARRAARLSFGAAEHVKDELRTAGLRGILAEAGRDLRHARRALRRRPSFAIAVVATLGLGIGVSTAMYSVVHAVVLRPLPYPDSDRLVAVWETYPSWRGRPVLGELWDRIGLAWPDYEQWRRQQQSFDAVAVFHRVRMTVTGAGAAEVLEVGRSSASLWPLLGSTPLAGRTFAIHEEGPGAPAVAVLSHELWRRRFAEDAAVVGRTLHLDGRPFSIVGVLEPDFRFSGEQGPPADVWIPAGSAELPMGEDNHSFSAIGRLRRDVTIGTAADEAAALFRGDRPVNARGASLRPYHDEVVGSARPPLLLLLGGTVVLLLIACLNGAALIAGDAARREREVATRRALGATRARVVRQFVAESLALSVAAVLAGIAVAAGGVPVLVSLAPFDLPRVHEIGLDAGVLGFALLAALATTLVSSAASIFVLERRRAAGGLQPASWRATAPGRRAQPIFVGLQVLLLSVLVTAAALLGRSLLGIRAVDPGFATSNLLTFAAEVPASRFETRAQLAAYYERLVDALRIVPGVAAVTGVSTGPFADGSESTSVGIEGLPERAAKPEMQRRVVLPDYVETMGLRIVDGAIPAATDARSVAVSETMASRLWPGARAIGRRISLRDVWYTVDAVVSDVRDRALADAPQGTYYVSLAAAREDSPRMRLMLRTVEDPRPLSAQVRETATAVDPAIPMSRVATMAALMAESLSGERYRALLTGLFAAASLLLAAVGIFGVTLRQALRRRREFAVCLALGAKPAGLLAGTLGRTAAGAGAGLAAGLAIAAALMPRLTPYLHDVSARDTVTYAATAMVLLFASLAAAAIPAVRAAQVNVVDVLRED
jgi:putative ABC transport system permease protein